ncbi:hypothetical protein P280DRAFT_499474 [Massarina eburnea CBS 473.64]|uniref:Uncharacterized protein n=1 Tax=Massarina eburnea CBS 473.64 TaxID=1395130 RepID=A0A6A6RYB7_9PLEO|nr:hypothetical protein P280DRAFT_499474 [Massarina eburnea CBS 473.64]
MATEVVLYDLACTKNVCFSPTVWRIRLILNYKKIPYRTVFLEFPDIEPTLKGLGLVPSESASTSQFPYTVPAIHHMPSNTYMMDSVPIAMFLDATYPDPPVPLMSELGREVQAQSRAVVGTAFRMSIMPREINILSPRSQEYFRRTREASIGHRLEDLLNEDKEGEIWEGMRDGMRAVGELMRTNKAKGPFILGGSPTSVDFFIAGSLQSARMVHEGTFQRIMAFSGFKEIYDACVPYMETND